MNPTHQTLLRLHLTAELGRVSLFRLKRFFGDFPTALDASPQDWQAAGVAARLYHQVPSVSDPVFCRTLESLNRGKIAIVSFWDDSYPSLLREIHDPPALFYLRGRLPQQECFAIVGSRRATGAGLATTRKLAAVLAQHDICVVSGLARGIDSAAHRGALQTGGATIAVLGCGIDAVYPRENLPLYHDIIQQHAVISEYPPGTPPLAGHFPGRNRIISGLSRGVLIVEAAEKSGSLITGDFALEQGRELFAIPGAPHQTNSRGTNRLLKEGAQLVTEAEDILQSLWPHRLSRHASRQLQAFADSLNPEALKVYQQLTYDPLHSDEIARKCGLTPMELSAILLDLELLGGIQALPGNHYIRSRA